MDRYEQMFVLRPEEAAFVATLEPNEQKIYNSFRDSFLFTMGSKIPMLHYFFVYAPLNIGLFTEIQEEDYFKPPEYLLAIRAPEHHVKSGKPEKGEKAIEEITADWGSLTFAIEKARVEGLVQENIDRFLLEFIKRDIEFVKGEMVQFADEGIKSRSTGRVTVEDRRASFTREILMQNKYDSFFAPETILVITEVRKALVKTIAIIRSMELVEDIDEKMYLMAREGVLKEYEEWGFALRDGDEIQDKMFKGRVLLQINIKFFEYLKLLVPSMPELSETEQYLLKTTRELIKVWELKHTGESFLNTELSEV